MIFEAATSMFRISSGVSSTETGPVFSSKPSSFEVPGMGTIHGFWAMVIPGIVEVTYVNQESIKLK
jgi:hypothetical protein